MFHILNGKHTGRLGVIQRSLDDGSSVPLSGKERMLIDIAGRPVYAGGIELLLQVYKAAAEHVSAKRMARLLAQLDYVYPYHQVVGFYMDRSGAYRRGEIDQFRKLDMPWKFYLTHGMTDRAYSKDWRPYYPKVLA